MSDMNVGLRLFLLFSLLNVCRSHSIQKRITSGSEAIPHSRPYHVHYIMWLAEIDVQICGGALISPSYVLTAAHCFRSLGSVTQAAVILGAHDLRQQQKEVRVTTKFILHKGYKQFPDGHTKNDIALIKLDEPVKLSKTIQVVSLPKRHQTNESFNNALVIEAGWGKTDEEVSFILMQGTSRVAEDEPICTFPKPLICTVTEDGHAPCDGDSGGPLVVNDTIIGILSVGYCVGFSYFTRVTSFLDWIQENSDVKILE